MLNQKIGKHETDPWEPTVAVPAVREEAAKPGRPATVQGREGTDQAGGGPATLLGCSGGADGGPR